MHCACAWTDIRTLHTVRTTTTTTTTKRLGSQVLRASVIFVDTLAGDLSMVAFASLLVSSGGSAVRRRERRLRGFWRHEQFSIKMALASATHHSWQSRAVSWRAHLIRCMHACVSPETRALSHGPHHHHHHNHHNRNYHNYHNYYNYYNYNHNYNHNYCEVARGSAGAACWSDDGRHSLGSCCPDESTVRCRLLRECDPAPADPRALLRRYDGLYYIRLGWRPGAPTVASWAGG